jgi:hypothetical protein
VLFGQATTVQHHDTASIGDVEKMPRSCDLANIGGFESCRSR